MLTIVLPAINDDDGIVLGAVVQLEHSLVSLSKWESIHEKVFFGREEKTVEETRSYIEQMVVGQDVPKDFKERLTPEHITACNSYINSKQSATFFREEPGKAGSREVVTSELIYYWLIQFQIPFSCENWHLNRLMTLIKICGIKQTKPKPMSKSAMAAQYRQLNAQRREQLGTAG